jgi:bifunctional polynucleotide phosphatase/kinase
VVILSNQGGITLAEEKKPSKKDADRLSNFKEKAGYVLNQLDIPISIYAATGKDHYRKPRVGMWEEFLDDYDLDENAQPDFEHSIFVGDAAGRVATKGFKADHSSGDRCETRASIDYG